MTLRMDDFAGLESSLFLTSIIYTRTKATREAWDEIRDQIKIYQKLLDDEREESK